MDKNRMDNKAQLRYSGKVMRHWYWCVLVVLLQLVLTAAVLYVNTLAGCIVGGFTVVLILSLVLLDVHYRSRVLIELMDFAHKFSGIEKEMLKNFLVPYAIVQPDGKLVWMNDMMAELTGKDADYHKNISTLFPAMNAAHFPLDEEARSLEIEYNERRYRVDMKRVWLSSMLEDLEGVEQTGGESCIVALYFFDITELLAFKQENYEQKPAVGLLYMDNYDEVMESVEDIRRSMLEALVDRKITKYVSSVGGLISKLEKGRYLLVVNRKGLETMVEDRFSVLEDVKTVNIGNSINMTVSIGIGISNEDYVQNFEAGRGAMEMALARGGDQAVVKEQDKLSFFGGKTQRAERNTRVRARVKAQALRELINSRDRVIVMGHKMTDIDSLGACVGICRAAKQVNKPAYIVLGDVNSGIRPWISVLEANENGGERLFLDHEQAIEMINYNTTLVVVDTNRPSMTECEELLYLTRTIVVLDHHRQGAEKIQNASLSYIEPSASSACEMVAEILQYYDDGIRLKQSEADCMYAGIVVDTQNFVAKTGMRTFEAAAFLRRNGADMTRVRKSFRDDMSTYKARAEAVRHAEAFMGCYAISICPSDGLENPTVTGAQAANELLNIVGVKASFVLTEYMNKVYISARAMDEVNVQIIMERMGGGGHMDIAGAQLEGIDAEEARVRLKEVLTQMTKEGAI
jgi:c-di-AMP phosphodiesterase-like protein